MACVEFQKHCGTDLLIFVSYVIGRLCGWHAIEYNTASFSTRNSIYSLTSRDTLFFIIYINDLSSIMQHSSISLYADDSKIFRVIRNQGDCEFLAEDLTRVEEWEATWQMSINPTKCELLSIGAHNMNFSYQLDNCALGNANQCRDLGVYVSKNLSFSYHCNIIARNAHYRRRQFQHSFACKDRDFQVFLFKTYIRPMIESSSEIWSPHHIGDIDKVESVQRKFTKFLPGMFNVPYRDRLERLGLDIMEIRRIRADLVLMYKMVYGLIDIDYNDYFSINERRSRGNSIKISVQHCRIDCRKFFFVNRTTMIWNSLDDQIVKLDNIVKFKRALLNCDFSSFCRGRA